jgi:hypothetical protein
MVSVPGTARLILKFEVFRYKMVQQTFLESTFVSRDIKFYTFPRSTAYHYRLLIEYFYDSVVSDHTGPSPSFQTRYTEFSTFI